MLIKKEYQEQKLTHISRSGWTCRRNGFFRAILPFICEIRSPYLKNVIQFFWNTFGCLPWNHPSGRIWPPSMISRITLATPFQDQAPPVEEPSLLVHQTHTPRLLQNSQGLGETFWSAILECNAFHLTRIIRRSPARGHLTNEHYIATESHEMTRNNNFWWEQVWKLKTRPWNNFP